VMDRRYLTIKEVAELLRVKPVTVRVWLHRGLDIPHLKINSHVCFPEKKLERWLEKKEDERKKRNFEI
jgi:excisionase family DNA binding protein